MKLGAFLFVIFLSLLAAAHSGNAAAQVAAPGDLDTSFGSAGRVLINFRNVQDTGRKAVVAPDGKIYQFGAAWDGTIHDASIARLNEDGSLDPTFDGDGKLTVHFPDSAASLFFTGAVQPDGKLLAVGSLNNGENTLTYCLIARFTAAGSLDPTFNNTGYKIFRLPLNFNYLQAVSVQPDGKIVVGGALEDQMMAARLHSNGEFDAAFGVGGYRRIVLNFLSQLNDLKITPEGKILLAGKTETDTFDANYSDFVLARLTASGQLDNSFGDGGIKIFDITPNTTRDAENLMSVQLLPNGNFLVLGRIGDTILDAAVMRFTAAGLLDLSFGDAGVKIVDYNAQNNLPQDMAIQSDGKIVIASAVQNNFLVQRLFPDGRTDAGFGAQGSVVTDLGGRDLPFSIGFWQNRILVAGQAGGQNSAPRVFAIARYFMNAPPGNSAVLRGRLVNLQNRPIAGAEVTIAPGANAPSVTTQTDLAGNFEFLDVVLSQSYTLTPQAARCYFAAPQMNITFSDPNSFYVLRGNCFRLIK